MEAELKRQYFKILAEELVPALGCTEPIAIALASAKAREVLGVMPERIVAKCSGNLVKNVKCVIVPNTDDLVGIEASAIMGAVGGDCSKGMEVLGGVTKEQIRERALQKGNLRGRASRYPAKSSPYNRGLRRRRQRGRRGEKSSRQHNVHISQR